MSFDRLIDPEIRQRYTENQINDFYRALNNNKAKHILDLLEENGSVSIDEAVESISGYNGNTGDLEIRLRHNDFPRLEEAGIVHVKDEKILPAEGYSDARKILSDNREIDLGLFADQTRRDLILLLEEKDRNRYDNKEDIIDDFVDSRAEEYDSLKASETDYGALDVELHHVHLPYLEEEGLLEESGEQIIYDSL